MNALQHTPGPWTASREVGADGAWGIIAPDLGEHASPGELRCVASYMTKADAEFAAAAPEMAEALAALVAKLADTPCSCSLKEIESGHSIECHAVELDALVDAGRAALARAEGRS